MVPGTTTVALDDVLAVELSSMTSRPRSRLGEGVYNRGRTSAGDGSDRWTRGGTRAEHSQPYEVAAA